MGGARSPPRGRPVSGSTKRGPAVVPSWSTTARPSGVAWTPKSAAFPPTRHWPTAARGDVPVPYGPVMAGRDHYPAVRRERDRLDVVGMPYEAVQLPAAGDVPDAHGAVVTSGSQQLAVGREGDGADAEAVAAEPADVPGRAHVPEANGGVRLHEAGGRHE